MLELRITSAGQTFPIFDLPAQLGRQAAAREIGDTIEGLIAFMDDLGGDPDLEDSETGSAAIDATGRYFGSDISAQEDEDREPDDDAFGDVSWNEWSSRKRFKVTAQGAEIVGRDAFGNMLCEDAEDDDPAEHAGDEFDGLGSEDDFMRHPSDGPGCPIADSDHGAEEIGEVASYAEWHTLAAGRRRAGEINGKPINEWNGVVEEDDEADDPLEANGDEQDGGAVGEGSAGTEEDFMVHTSDGGAGCPLADPGGIPEPNA